MLRGPLYLSATDVRASMPPVAERIELAERAMTALVADAELPPKIGVHPRPAGSFAHAMPALLRPTGNADASIGDLLGIKWVTGFPDNRSAGLGAISAIVVLSDPATGQPVAILDGGPITAERTAAVSGVAMARFAAGDAGPHDRSVTVAIIGAGVQGASHLEVIGHLLAGATVVIHDRHPERAIALCDVARGMSGISDAQVTDDAREATMAAHVVVTCVSFSEPAARQPMTGDWLRDDALVIPVDYATMCAASVARDAALFLVDDRGQFLANRDAGQFDGYPDPAATFGEAIVAGTPRPPGGRVVATHLGVGLADVVFADAIVARARAAGRGITLPA